MVYPEGSFTGDDKQTWQSYGFRMAGSAKKDSLSNVTFDAVWASVSSRAEEGRELNWQCIIGSRLMEYVRGRNVYDLFDK